MRVDFHQHLWPQEVTALLRRRSTPPLLHGRTLVLPAGGRFELDPSSYAPEARLAELGRAGLDAAVVSLPPTCEPTPDLIDAWHAAAPQLAASSSGRLIPLAYRSVQAGFAGTIVPAADLSDLDRLGQLLDRLEAADLVLFVHPGPAPVADRGWWAAGVAYVCQMQAAYAAWIAGGPARWPRLRVVFALLGGGAPFQVERLVRRGVAAAAPFAPNLWFETSSYGERALELSLQTFGTGRLLFGSDAPIDRVADARRVVAHFGPTLEDQLVRSNPAAALGRERRAWAA
jgi:6-methylsalicylate decarboxylase